MEEFVWSWFEGEQIKKMAKWCRRHKLYRLEIYLRYRAYYWATYV